MKSETHQTTAATTVGQPGTGHAKKLQIPRTDAEMVMDYQTLRAVIGAVAFLLVPAVYIGNWLIFTHQYGACFLPNSQTPGSLSGFYYTHMRNLFVGAMCAIGVFLAAYRGHDRWDSRLTNIAGLAAVCIALFPTLPPNYSTLTKGNPPKDFVSGNTTCGPVTPITYHLSADQQFFRWVHEPSLVVLFLMVFLMVLVQFTRTNPHAPAQGKEPEAEGQSKEPGAEARAEDPQGQVPAVEGGNGTAGNRGWWSSRFNHPERKKRRRNRVYMVCAGLIALCGLLALASGKWPSAKIGPWPLLLIAESGAFVFFGIAWYVKGAASDPPKPKRRLPWPLSWLIWPFSWIRQLLADD